MERIKKVRRFVHEMRERNLTMVIAESVTCGLAAHGLSTIMGTSEVLKASVVCYSPEAKTSALGVPARLIERHSAESRQVTEAMARGLKKLVKADVYAAVTGLATPGGSETRTKPVGTVFICVIYGKRVWHFRKVFRTSPVEIRRKTCLMTYQKILEIVAGTRKNGITIS